MRTLKNANDWDQARCCSSIRLEMRVKRRGSSIFAHAETEKQISFSPHVPFPFIFFAAL